MKITAMTYNIASGRDLAKERDMRFSTGVIKQVQPDFVVLNEVRRHTADVPVDQANEAGRLTGYYPVFGKSIDILGGEYGNAFLTRHPLIGWEVIHIPDRRSEEKAAYEHRTVFRAVIDVKGTLLTVLGTHFGLAKCEEEAAVETVLALLKKEDGPVVLMGDLNMRPDDPVLRPLLDQMTDSAGGREKPMTFPSDMPDRKIDYIMVRGLKVISLRTMDTQASDHRPLIAELDA